MSSNPRWRAIAGGVAILAVTLACSPVRAAMPGPPGRTGEAAGPFTLTYVANMGVLVSSGDTKVLVDALFDRPNPDYRAPTPETLGKIMKGEAPFDGVDLVLVTHDHPDHFDAALAVRFLEARSEPVLVAPQDAVEAMRRAAADWPRIEPRVVPVGLEVGEKRSLDVMGIPVMACRTLHSGDRDSPMNLMYLFEIDGRRVWHEGDPNGRCEIFEAFGLKDARLDLAVVHFWYPLEPSCARFLQEALRPEHIVLTHLPVRLEGDAPGKIDLIRQYYKDIVLALPGAPARVLARGSGREKEAANVQDTIMKTEDSAMEAWRRGDPMRWVEISDEEIVYVDPALDAPVVGRKAYARYLEPIKGQVLYDASEYVDPRVAVYGDTAVLTYNYHSLKKDADGTARRTSFWNTTEVYRLVEGAWKIVHTHWSYIRHRRPEGAAIELPGAAEAPPPLGGAAAEIMKLETAALARWRKGDPRGFLEISAPEVTAFDPDAPGRLTGREELERAGDRLAGLLRCDTADVVVPRLRVFEDSAVLFYQLLCATLGPDGAVGSRVPWNCTAVYAKAAGGWRLVHAHRSLVKGEREGGGI